MASTPLAASSSQHPLRNRSFRLFFIGSAISWTGDQFYLVALPWLVLSLTTSSVILGSVAMLAAVPRAVLMLVGGAVSDRISPRRVLMVTAVTRMLLVSTMAALLFLRRLSIWEVYCLAFGFGIADAFSYPAGSALLPSIVEPKQLTAANSIAQSTLQITTLAAPGPVGLFIRSFGTAWAFLIDGISFLAIPLVLAKLADTPRPEKSGPQRNMMKVIYEGLKYVRSDVALRSLMLVIGALNFSLAGPMDLGLAVIAKQRFGTPTAFGILMSSFAVGSLVGTFCAGLAPHRRRGHTLLIASALIGLCVLPLGLISQIAVLVPDLVLMGGIAAFLNVQLVGWFQERTAREFMGRVMSVLMFASVGLMPLSFAVAGILLKASVTVTFVGTGVMVLLVTLIAASHRAVRTID